MHSASTSIEDFAIRVGLNPDILQFFQKDLEIYTSDSYPFEKTMKQARGEVILARALEKFGLLDLKLRKRSKSKLRQPQSNGYYYPKYLNSDTELNRNNQNNRNSYYNGQSNYQGYRGGYDRDRSRYNDYDSYYGRNNGKNRNYNSNRNNDYYYRKQEQIQRNPYYSGTANNNYYNRKYDSSNYNRYVPYTNKPSQQEYNYNKAKPSNINRNSQYNQYEEEKPTKNKLVQSADKDKIYNNYDNPSGEKSSDETGNDINSNLPKYIAYKWNTKPKEKPSKSRYIYYG